jgi:hypothetical protein
VTSDFDVTGTGTTVTIHSNNVKMAHVIYELKFGEQYGASGSIVNYADDTLVTGTLYGFNGSLDSQDWLNYIRLQLTQFYYSSHESSFTKTSHILNCQFALQTKRGCTTSADTTNKDALLEIVTYDGAFSNTIADYHIDKSIC